MPAKDTYHDQVKNALIKDGWTITHDPYTISYGKQGVFADFGAQKSIAAQKGEKRIVVEAKSFINPSDLRDLEAAVGQYMFYLSLLTRLDPGRKLFLAIPEFAFMETFQ